MQKVWWGLRPYTEIETLQKKIHGQMKEDSCGFFLLAGEHPAVITLGIRGAEEDLFNSLGLPVVKTDRGGRATLHNEGQLVIYPILRLADFSLKVKDFVCLLEGVSQKTLGCFGVLANRPSEPGQSGLETSQGKIMSVGLRVQDGISRHGLAINISNELGPFGQIRACGMTQRPMDKLENWSKGVSCQKFFDLWVHVFLEDLTHGRSSSNFCNSAHPL